ncbi:hypothetical protein Pla52n_33160 [Stieleria varia]|uniref:Uncharacterized protein n=1 Tax=Stieleria varia TaxID=2528005 RepID=A0A5C6AT66_9BACT|nr:hypothetical protein Pla52n_33160 [Stieleria varia]
MVQTENGRRLLVEDVTENGSPVQWQPAIFYQIAFGKLDGMTFVMNTTGNG